MIKYESVSVFRVQADVPASASFVRPLSVPRTRQFNDTLLANVRFCNYQGREVLVYSLIDEATRFHVTQVVPSQSARDLYEAIMNAWARAPRFLLIDPHRSHLARQFMEQLGAQGTTVLVGACRGFVDGAYVRSMVEKMVHDGVPEDMSVQSLCRQSDISQKHDEQNSRIFPVTMGACHATENP